jgi:hypothetical protein
MELEEKALRPDADHPSSARDLKEQGQGGTRRRRSTDFDSESVVTELATSVADLHAAYRLVYERYLSEGYQEPTPGKLRFIAHCCLPESYTFVARSGGEIIATLSLIKDRELGLPLETEYSGEIVALREQGRELAEVSCLATREGVDQSVVLQLIRTMYSFARYRAGVTDWVIAVNPKRHPHVHFAAAQKYIDWITSPETQRAIGEYEFQRKTLFHPAATKSQPD